MFRKSITARNFIRTRVIATLFLRSSISNCFADARIRSRCGASRGNFSYLFTKNYNCSEQFYCFTNLVAPDHSVIKYGRIMAPEV